jgi:hypothetical protein
VESRLCSGTLNVSGSNLGWFPKRPECNFIVVSLTLWDNAAMVLSLESQPNSCDFVRTDCLHRHHTTQHTTLTRDKYPCPLAGFEPTIRASERQQTDALDRAVTGIGHEGAS